MASVERDGSGTVTPRERELAEGCSTREAAAVLAISVRTAGVHRASLMRKLGARGVADVVRYCLRSRLVEL